MLVEQEKEIFNSIAKYILSSELDDKWDNALLKMMIIGDTVDYNLSFSYPDGSSKNTKLNNAFSCSVDVLKLHQLTNEHPNYKNWNKAEFKLYSGSKCRIEYIWDEALENEVNRFNR